MTQQDFLAQLVATNAAAAGLSVEAYRRRQLAALREDLRELPEDDDCQACNGRGWLGRFGEMRCPECN